MRVWYRKSEIEEKKKRIATRVYVLFCIYLVFIQWYGGISMVRPIFNAINFNQTFNFILTLSQFLAWKLFRSAKQKFRNYNLSNEKWTSWHFDVHSNTNYAIHCKHLQSIYTILCVGLSFKSKFSTCSLRLVLLRWTFFCLPRPYR